MSGARGLIVYSALLIVLGIGSAAIWIAATGSFRVAWWWLAVSSLVVAVGADWIEQALSLWLRRRRNGRRRAPARHGRARKAGL